MVAGWSGRRQCLGALLHVGADIGPGEFVGTHGAQGEAVDDLVGARFDDGQHHAPLNDEGALGGGAALLPALGAYLGPVIGYRYHLPAFEGVPPAVLEVVGVDALARPVEP